MALTKNKKKAEGLKKGAKKIRDWSARWKKANSIYQLTESDLEICNNVKAKWSETPPSARNKLLREAIKDVAKSYCKRKGKKNMDPLVQEKIDRAVRKWVRLKTRTRAKAAKIGTKGWHPRRVFYQQHKQEVADWAAELAENGRQNIGKTAKALTDLFDQLSQEEKDDLRLIAHEWNNAGPPESVQQG